MLSPPVKAEEKEAADVSLNRPLPELGLLGMAIPNSGRTIPVTGIVVKRTVGIVSGEALTKKKASQSSRPITPGRTGIVKGSTGIVGFNGLFHNPTSMPCTQNP